MKGLAPTPSGMADSISYRKLVFKTTTSDPVALNGWVPIGILVPQATGTGNITLQAKIADSEYADVVDQDGNAITITANDGTYTVLQPPLFPGFHTLRFVVQNIPAEDVYLMMRKVND